MPAASTLFRAAVLALVRLFYPVRAVRGAVPTQGPVIVVANHPNGLLDPLVLCAALDRPLAFLAKSTLFDGPLRPAMRGFGAIPVYRAGEADTRKNEETFAQARARLAGPENAAWLALFPEGKSHDGTELAPLRTGAARIALGAAPHTRLLPVGLCYEDKGVFRSRVSVTIGRPITLDAYRSQHADDPRAAVDLLTDTLAAGLRDVLLEADDAELWHGFRAVAGWLAPHADVAARDAEARRLAEAWRRLGEADPEARERLAERARALGRTLEALGVEDPFGLEGALPSPVRLLARAVPLVLLAPLALLGSLLNWPVYRAIRPLARRMAGRHEDVLGTYKLLLGALLLPLSWGLTALAAGRILGWPIGVATLALAPLSGFVALRWDERWTARRAALRGVWARLTQARVAAYAAAERRALAEAIQGFDRAAEGSAAPDR